jgi:hypothetical protein
MAEFKDKEYFDVSRIVSIHFTVERPAYKFCWVDRKPIKRFFGFINTGKFTEPGWINQHDWGEIIYTDEEIRNSGYKVYTKDERINDRVCYFPHVKVYLTDDNTIEQVFKSNEEAEAWVENLKTTSGKDFAVAVYK